MLKLSKRFSNSFSFVYPRNFSFHISQCFILGLLFVTGVYYNLTRRSVSVSRVLLQQAAMLWQGAVLDVDRKRISARLLTLTTGILTLYLIQLLPFRLRNMLTLKNC